MTTTIGQVELDRFLEATREVLRDAEVQSARGRAVRSTPRGGAYPFVYTRDLAGTIAGLCEVGAVDAARDFCRFLLRVQAPDGSWVQRYDADGTPAAAVVQEDATALAVWALLTYAKAANDLPLVEIAREPIERAARYTAERTLNPYLYLVQTTTSIHQTEVSAGYEIWNSCAHAAAFALCHRVYGGERYRRLGLMIRRAIGQLLFLDGRFLRRLEPDGRPDPRTDVTLMSPFYFGLWSPTERAVMNSAELVERNLWNVEIGGYVRYLPYSPAERTIPPGPWPHFTAWMAQYHYAIGNQDRAEAIVRWLFDCMSEGRLPETIVPGSVVRRFVPELRASAQTRDGAGPTATPASEWTDPEVHLDRLERLAAQQDLVAANEPFLWSHVETLRALKRGGYVEDWQAESTAHHPT